MDKKKAIENSKKAVSIFFRVRRGFKIFVAFAIGILSAVYVYKDIYAVKKDTLISVVLSVLLGVFITTVMLLTMKLTRIATDKAQKAGTKLYSGYKERKSSDEKEE